MSKKLLFAAIASILTLNAFADSKTITTQDYVDNKFQTKIPAKSTASEYSSASLVEATGTAGSVSERKIFDHLVDWNTDPDGDSSFYSGNVYSNDDYDEIIPSIPTVGAVAESIDVAIRHRQYEIPKAGYGYIDGLNQYVDYGGASNSGSWLFSGTKGSALVTKTDQDGVIGERKIFESTDVSGYHATGLTQDQKDIQDISIPTVGAMMTAIANSQVTLPTGTAGNVVTYNSNGVVGGSVATYDGSGTYNAGTDAGKIATAAAVETKQNKMTCTRWLDNAEHTDANCLLWSIN